jgi:hypothetical protein
MGCRKNLQNVAWKSVKNFLKKWFCSIFLRLAGDKIRRLGIFSLVFPSGRLSSQWFKFGRHLKNKSP